MAKNKKAQILAAVMCAATVAGVSPAISSAADTSIGATDTVTVNGTSYTGEQLNELFTYVGDIQNAGIVAGTVNPTSTDGAIAIGDNATIDSWATNAIAIGKNSYAKGTGAVAIGENSKAAYWGAVAVGRYARANVNNSTALGAESTANGENTVAVGYKAQAINDEATAIGVSAVAKGHGAISIGNNSMASATNTVSVGIRSHAFGTSSVAVGADAEVEAGTRNSVAIGAGSVADESNVFSIGNENTQRRIVNVADGINETDAATVGQMNAATEGTVKWDKDTDGNYQEGMLKGVKLSEGTVTAKDIITDTINVAEGQFIVDEDGISAADGKFTVNGLGEVTAKAGVDDNSIFRLTENGVEMQSGNTALNVTSGGVEVRGINGLSTYINGNEINTGTVLANEMYIGSKADENAVATIGDINTTVGEATENTKGIERDEATGTTTIENNTSISKDGITYKGENGLSTTIDGNGIAVGDKTFIKDGEITTGNINVGSINGKDVSDLASNADVAGLKDRVGTVETDVKDIKEDIGDVNTIDGEIKGDNIVSSINNEASMRRSEISRIDNDIKHLDSRVGSLEDRMGDVEDRIDKVGAMAAAIANLRTMGYDPEAPTEIAVGVGQYESETGLALGVFHYPNQDFMLSASISTSGDEVMGGIGATWKIGRKSAAEKARSVEEKRVAKAEEMQEMAKAEKVKAQRERHAQMLAEREAAK